MDTRKKLDSVPVDRDWAWTVMMGNATFIWNILMMSIFTGSLSSVMIISMLEMGMAKSFGLFFVEFQKKFDVSSSFASLSGGLFGLTMSIAALPVMTVGQERLSCRQCVMIGGVFRFAGFVFTSISPNMSLVVFCQGILLGIGSSFIHGPSLAILGLYFHKRLGLANGMCNGFGSFGAIVIPIIVSALFEKYDYMGALLISSSLFFNCTLFGTFLRPKSFYGRESSSIIEDTDNGVLLPCETKNDKNTLEQQTSSTSMLSVMNSVDSLQASLHEIYKNKTQSKDNQTKKRTNKICDVISKVVDFKTLRNPLILLFMGVFSFGSIGCSVAVIFIPPYADENHMSREQIALLVVVYGAANCVGRFVVGIIADAKFVQRYRLSMITVFITGIILLFSEFCTEFWSLCVFTSLYGFFSGTLVTLYVPVCIDFLGPDEFTGAVGLLVSAQGVIYAVFTPVIGAIKDSFGSYIYGFYFMGVITILAASLLLFVPLIQRKIKNKENENDS